MDSGFHLVVLLCLTSGLWMEANAKCHGDPGHCCCKSGWTLFGTRCFKFFFEEKQWTDAENHCIDLGGNLASVHTVEEYPMLTDLVRESTGGGKIVWLGGHDGVKEGTWFWSDGMKFTGLNSTMIMIADNNDDLTDCLALYHKNENGSDNLKFLSCAKPNSFICSAKI